MPAQIILFLVGLFLLLKSADWLVSNASLLAKKFQVSDLAIGLTIVSFGTSAPEFVVNTFASYRGDHDIVCGNIIGSNNFNLFVILGLSGLIRPMVVKSGVVRKEIPFSLFAVLIFFFLANDEIFFYSDSVLSFPDGMVLSAFFAGFLYYIFRNLKMRPAQLKPHEKKHSTLKLWFFILLGLAGLFVGGRMAVTSAESIAIAFGISQKIIGLTILAAGTSLPELAASLMAAIKKKNDIAIGNIIGSNIFNIFFILGASAMVRPISFNSSFNVDLAMLAGGTIFLFSAMFLAGKKKLDRWEAALLLIAYIGYMYYLITKGGPV